MRRERKEVGLPSLSLSLLMNSPSYSLNKFLTLGIEEKGKGLNWGSGKRRTLKRLVGPREVSLLQFNNFILLPPKFAMIKTEILF